MEPCTPDSGVRPDPAPRSRITLGILAGGLATRLGGVDKAWLERGGVPQVLRRAAELQGANGVGFTTVLVSANRNEAAYARHGLRAVRDVRTDPVGPLAGLEALAAVAATDWLLTVPVDLVALPPDTVDRLWAARSGNGSFAIDSDGPQPLVALWRVAALRPAVRDAIEARELAAAALGSRLGLSRAVFSDAVFGNLNTPAELAAVGVRGHAPAAPAGAPPGGSHSGRILPP